MNNEIKNTINAKAMNLNARGDLADYFSNKIYDLNTYIEDGKDLSEQQIENILSEIVNTFALPLFVPIGSGVKFLRAIKNCKNHRENKASELSYLPQQFSSKAALGRLNKKSQSVYYGCMYFSEEVGVNVAFSESNAKVGDTVNILRSETTSDINCHYVGLYDHVFRQSKPQFMPQEMFEYFTEVQNHQKYRYSKNVFMAQLLCEAFVSDILRRKESGNLYKVTSKLFDIYSGFTDIDGILYTSVKSERSPVVALKTESVDTKMQHKSCGSYKIIKNYGYAKYYAQHTHVGTIDANNAIAWSIR